MTGPLEQLSQCTGFQWDEGKAEKNWLKDKVTRTECEEVFFNQPLLVAVDARHSGTEPRLYALGQTDERRLLFMVFTIRDRLIRVISARPMSRREKKEYRRAQAEEGSAPDTEV